MKTYISLFSSAGVGCYGFKMEGFECIATNEIIKRRLDVQRFNNKCKYDTGYICADITKKETKDALYKEIEFWKKQEKIKEVDVVIATPPCQGMSVANHKKSDTEIIRNSLVVESIKIIKEIYPKFFVFENVPAFMKTICTDVDGNDKPINEAICNNLGRDYSYISKIINFKNYGACSSRTRTIVIGVRKDYADEVSPYELLPDWKSETTLRQAIGDLPSLNEMGQIDSNDIYHFFRIYPGHMRQWISDLSQGQSAFENEDIEKKPHQVIDGKIVINKQKNGDKYRRQIWDKVGPCIHTRNDQLASQNTIHPSDDRVFSIRELMRMMTVPYNFKWSNQSLEELNQLPLSEKRAYLKKEEIKIRQSLGEAVPTTIFREIAKKISHVLSHHILNNTEINKIINEQNFTCADDIISFIKKNPQNLSFSTLCRIAELSNTNRTDNAAYYTNKALITEMIKRIPDSDNKMLRIIEPSVGVGNFIPVILKKFEGKKIVLDLVDIDEDSIKIASALIEKYNIPCYCKINFIVDDFLLHEFKERYDYAIGNPPFYKMKRTEKLLENYRSNAINKKTNNICSFFLDKASKISNYVVFVLPKLILNTPEFKPSRDHYSLESVESIIDFGEKGFPGILIETVALLINTIAKPKNTEVFSVTRNLQIIQKQSYIFDNKLPYWIIYRNEKFDLVCKKMDFNCFDVFRDRQITKKNSNNKDGDIRILKSRNISDDGSEIIDIDGYDSFISKEEAKKLNIYNFLNRDDVYLTPNMTYKPRVIKKPKGVLVNGSVAILIPKYSIELSSEQYKYYSTDEYREFYQVARNYQTRSLNVDACSVFFYGVLRDKPKSEILPEVGQITIFNYMED